MKLSYLFNCYIALPFIQIFFNSDAERTLVERLASVRATHTDFTVLHTGIFLSHFHVFTVRSYLLYVNIYLHSSVLILYIQMKVMIKKIIIPFQLQTKEACGGQSGTSSGMSYA